MRVSGVEGDEVVFWLDDPGHGLAGVRLWQEVGLPGACLDLTRDGDGWLLRVTLPPVHRMEYLFELTHHDGSRSTALDPTNPRRVGGAFGDHSWLPLSGYAEPAWVDEPPVPSHRQRFTAAGTPVGGVHGEVWAPAWAEPSEPLPLLVAHDGPELDVHAGLTHYAGALIARGDLPPLRVALLAPGLRNAWYSADPGYAEALVGHVLPRLRDGWATTGGTVLMGASLGGLAALHAEWTHPGTFAGLFLQSGSFFTLDTDPQEQEFGFFGQVTSFVRAVPTATEPPSRPVVGMTVGRTEENVHNNRVMRAHLAHLGCGLRYGEIDDVHNFTCWRDMFDPCLTSLLRDVWGHRYGRR